MESGGWCMTLTCVETAGENDKNNMGARSCAMRIRLLMNYFRVTNPERPAVSSRALSKGMAVESEGWRGC